jgi:citrate lyase beta subunit
MQGTLEDLLRGSRLFSDVELGRTDDPDQLVIGVFRCADRILPWEAGMGVERLWRTAAAGVSCEAHHVGCTESLMEFEGAVTLDASGHYVTVHLGAEPSAPDGPELLYVRSKVLFDARAAGLDVILDAVFVDLDDETGFERDTRLGRRLGYTGRTAIHPRQVETINRVHSPSPGEVDDARALLEAFRTAEAEGLGAIRHRGRLVDYAMVRHAERLVERAGR